MCWFHVFIYVLFITLLWLSAESKTYNTIVKEQSCKCYLHTRWDSDQSCLSGFEWLAWVYIEIHLIVKGSLTFLKKKKYCLSKSVVSQGVWYRVLYINKIRRHYRIVSHWWFGMSPWKKMRKLVLYQKQELTVKNIWNY